MRVEKITVDCLQPGSLCLVTLLTLEKNLQFERIRLQHIKMVNKTSSVKTKLIDSNVEASRDTLCLSLPCSGQTTNFSLQINALSTLNRGHGTVPLNQTSSCSLFNMDIL